MPSPSEWLLSFPMYCLLANLLNQYVSRAQAATLYHNSRKYWVCACACRHHQNIEPASHGANDPGNDSNTELSKEGIKGHKEELKHMQVYTDRLALERLSNSIYAP